jgi:hypothetical protein
MGTRAAFWIGDPRDKENRQWLGCVAWDGYPSGLPQLSKEVPKTEKDFRFAIKTIKEERDDFADPKDGGWPFPWTGDIFLTDVTYAFFDGKVQITRFHTGFVPLEEYNIKEDEYPGKSAEERGEDPTLENVEFDGQWDRRQPDSIIILQARREENGS